MIIIPFIYFSLLLIYILNVKRRFELSALITSAYIITSFFAIIIDYKGLYGTAGSVKTSIEIIPTFLYCFLITLTIVPFIKLPSFNRRNIIPIRNLKLFNWIVYFYLGVFVLFLFFFGNEIVFKIQNPDISGLRLIIVAGEDDLGFSNYTGIMRIIARLIFIFASAAMFFHVFYFYSLTFLKNSTKFNLLILLFSALPILLGILSLDRSKMIYWTMSFIAVAVFYWPSFNASQKKQTKSTGVVFFGIIIIFLAVVTIARYGDKDIGAFDSLIVYAGQSFNNFNLFYNKLNLPGYSLEKVTPLLNSIIGSTNDISRADLYSQNTDTQVFASFSGILIREIGVWGSILYSFIYFMLATLVFKKIRKYSITNIFLVIIFLYIPYLGIFGLYYGSIDRELTVYAILIICYYLKRRYTV